MLMTKLQIATAGLLLVALLGTGVLLCEAAAQVPAGKAEAAQAQAQDQTIAYIDLQPKGNQKLKDDFHSGNLPGNNLANLPTGKQTFAGVKFNIGDAAIQLGSQRVEDKPEKVQGIKVDQKFDKLHILHATGYRAEEDTLIGEYVIHYADKTKENIEIVYGKDVIDWWFHPNSKEVTRGKKAWEGKNEAAQGFDIPIRLYLTTWENPHPGKQVVSIDYVSAQTNSAPFCVAMTVERKK
jgi:hypothetical protein